MVLVSQQVADQGGLLGGHRWQAAGCLARGEVTARTILYGLLQHEGAEKSAHETIEAQQEKWSSIAQLAAEYETIAQAAQRDRFAKATARSVRADEQAAVVVSGESFRALVAQLRRIEAEGRQPQQLLSRAV